MAKIITQLDQQPQLFDSEEKNNAPTWRVILTGIMNNMQVSGEKKADFFAYCVEMNSKNADKDFPTEIKMSDSDFNLLKKEVGEKSSVLIVGRFPEIVKQK